MKINVFLLLILFVFNIQIQAQNKLNYDKLDMYLDSLKQADLFSGLVLFANKDSIEYLKTIGYANRELKTPITLNTQFEMSSNSKLFTGVAIVQLAQEGKLQFTDTIGKYIPDLSYGSKVTIHHLLTHSSGLADFQNAKNFSYKGVTSCTDLLPYVKDMELKFNPGDSVLYATTGMILLGVIIEKITGETFRDYIQNNIFQPLNLTNTSYSTAFTVQGTNDNDSRFALGYIKDSTGNLVRYPKPDVENFYGLSAGGMYSSASDLLKFDRAIHYTNLIKPDYKRIMLTPYTYAGWPGGYFGYVWITINKPTNPAVGHGGDSPWTHNYFFHYLNSDKTLIVLYNFGDMDNYYKIIDTIEKKVFY